MDALTPGRQAVGRRERTEVIHLGLIALVHAVQMLHGRVWEPLLGVQGVAVAGSSERHCQEDGHTKRHKSKEHCPKHNVAIVGRSPADDAEVPHQMVQTVAKHSAIED